MSCPFHGMRFNEAFDTAKECEEARAKAVVPPDTVINRLTNSQPQPSPSAAQSAMPEERAFYCVSTDDVRLKPNLGQ